MSYDVDEEEPLLALGPERSLAERAGRDVELFDAHGRGGDYQR
jgi:hypothetical protein